MTLALIGLAAGLLLGSVLIWLKQWRKRERGQ